MELPPQSGFERLFDEDFDVLSFNASGTKMLGVDILLVRNNKKYVISVESLPLHMQRTMNEEDSDYDPDLEETAYVVPQDEILPSHIVQLRQTPTKDLLPYLVEQETED